MTLIDPTGRVITPGITTTRTDMPSIAEIAIAALVREIEGTAADDPAGAGADTPAGRPGIPMTLVVRQTTAQAPAPNIPHHGECE